MSDGQLLYLVFVAFYVFDGIVRLPRHCWIFLRPGLPGAKWRVRRPLEIASRPGEGFGMLPFTGLFLPVGEGWWFGDADETRWVDSPEQDGRTAGVKKRSKLWSEKSRIHGLRGAGVMTFPSLTSARRILRLLKVDLIPPDSLRRKSLSLPGAKAALKRCRIVMRCFEFSTGLLTFYVLVFLPLAFYWYRTTQPRLVLVTLAFYLTVVIAVRWWCVVKRLAPNGGKGRWYKVIPLLFLPYHTMRMPRHLAMEMTAGIHPLAFAKVSLEPEAFRSFASDFMRSLKYPLNRLATPEEWHRSFEECAEFLVEKCNLPRSDWESRELEPEDDSVSFCPRCLMQYVETNVECTTCRGVRTVAFPES